MILFGISAAVSVNALSMHKYIEVKFSMPWGKSMIWLPKVIDVPFQVINV